MRSSQAIQAIKERISIVDLVRRYVDLKGNGQHYVAPCPFHQETKPSFSVNAEKGFFYCFGCQASGDIFEFYSRINGVDFAESLAQLASEAGISIEYEGRDKKGSQHDKNASARQLMLAMHEAAGRYFCSALAGEKGQACRAYIRQRGISPEIVAHFGLGWAPGGWRNLADALRALGYGPDQACEAGLLAKSSGGVCYDRFRGRLIFPIKSLSGQIVAFGGRIIEDCDEAKYINSSDTPIYRKKEHIYGLAQARRGISSKGFAILTEGYMDVLTLHQYGYDNGIGVLGTALTPEQIRRISGFTSRIVLVFDGDGAGRKAALRSCAMLLARGLACPVVHLPDGEDIDSFLKAGGRDAFDQLCKSAPEGLRYCVGALSAFAPREAVEWVKNFLADVQVPELASPYASQFAQLLGISESALRSGLSPHDKSWDKNSGGTLHNIENMRDVQIMIFAIRYPERMNDLRDLGADLALKSAAARNLWAILEQYGAQEAFYHLNERQKNFWRTHRGPGSAPLTNADQELVCLKLELEKFYEAARKASLSAAIAENAGGDFAADLEYLRALQETTGGKNE